MSVKDGGPAFPVTEKIDTPYDTEVDVVRPGMTLRDYFAAAALTGMLASDMRRGFPKPHPNITSVDAYEYSDAMLEARKL